jgi:hypothetical protein
MAIGDWSVLDLIPSDRSRRGSAPVGTAAPEALVNAFVTDHTARHSEAGGSTLEVTAMDATYSMNLEEKVASWPNLPDSAIAAAIFGRHTIVPQIDPTSPVLTEPEGTTIQRGTDIRFLRRLARRNGFDCYVQPEPLTGLDMGHFHARRPTGPPSACCQWNSSQRLGLHPRDHRARPGRLTS